MPNRERSRNSLVSDPGTDSQHGYAAVLDLLDAEGFELGGFEAAFAFSEAEGIVAVVCGIAGERASVASLGQNRYIMSLYIYIMSLCSSLPLLTSRKSPPLIILPLIRDALKPPRNKQNLQPPRHRNAPHRLQRRHVTNIGKRQISALRKVPRCAGFWVKDVGAGGAEVEGEVDAVFLDHEADGGDHGDATVLDFGVLEPGEGLGASSLKDFRAEGGALSAKDERSEEHEEWSKRVRFA